MEKNSNWKTLAKDLSNLSERSPPRFSRFLSSHQATPPPSGARERQARSQHSKSLLSPALNTEGRRGTQWSPRWHQPEPSTRCQQSKAPTVPRHREQRAGWHAVLTARATRAGTAGPVGARGWPRTPPGGSASPEHPAL